MKTKTTLKISSFMLVFLMLLSPLAFATELKLVKVSDLTPGDILVDKNGNEIRVDSLQTKEVYSKTISELIREKVFGAEPESSNLDNKKIATFSPTTGSGQNGFGLALTGNVVEDPKVGETYNSDSLIAGDSVLVERINEDGTVTVKTQSGKEVIISKDSLFNKDTAISSQVSPVSPLATPSPVTSIGFNVANEKVSSLVGQKVFHNGKEATVLVDHEGVYDIKYSDGSTAVVYDRAELKVNQLSSKGVTITSKEQLKNFLSKSELDSLSEEEFNAKYSGSKIIDGVLVSSTSNEILSRGRVDTVFGNLNFGMGHIVQGATWAVAAYGLVQTLGGVFSSVSGDSGFDVDAASSAVSAGVFVGKLAYAGLGNGGVGGIGLNADGTKNLLGRNSGVVSGVVGAATAWLVYNSMYKKVDEKIETVSFSCLPWQAPRGGADCELCNDGELPCSEYRCKSLGQSCGLINVGTAAEQCVNQNPRDVNPPIVKPLDSALTEGLFYSDVKANPPGAGFKIKSRATSTGCIPPFKAFEFGIETNEPAQCKIDYESKGNYSDMKTYFGGDNLYTYNHTESLSLPSSEDFKNSSLKLENGKELNLFIRCRDSNGNTNEADYVLNICVDPSPDTTPPSIQATSIAQGSCVAANSDNATVDFYVNEPSECKWDFEDQEYSAMENNMSCSSSVKEINALQLYTCSTTLTGIARDSTKFYVRCKDQPTNTDENKRNTNAESYIFSLRGSNPLKMKNIQPNETIFGAVRPAPVELYVETLFGCDNNQAICYYSPTGNENSFIQFFDTNKADGIHTQRLDLQEGLYNYYVKCVDSGGNLAMNYTTFNLDIDTNAPVIARVYEEDDYLKLVTPRNSECVFTNDGCDFLFEEGVQMPYAESTTHITQWFSDKTYYIKCRDEFRTEPTDCSLIVRPTDNFL